MARAIVTLRRNALGADAARLTEIADQHARGAALEAAAHEFESHADATLAAVAADNVRVVAGGIEELSAGVSEVNARVTEAASIALDAATSVRDTDASVQALVTAAAAIGKLVQLIRDIAGAEDAATHASAVREGGSRMAETAAEVGAATAILTQRGGAMQTEVQSFLAALRAA